ncbi:hypothetical protein MUP77_17670 [Candidatus Bathyarchaeota archaeon]|nr:hypothetical protein [Candidatus Bathyarchaeota archaeon]
MATYAFDHWEVNGVTYTPVPLNIAITANTAITAFFREMGVPPPPGGQNYVPVMIAVSLVASIGLLLLLSRRK